MNRSSILGIAAAIISANAVYALHSDVTRYVDPMIGTGGHGHVFLGANVPFGLVQLGPSQKVKGWDWCSGYHHSDSTLLGFSHTHLSGTGIGDLGDILVSVNTRPEFGETRFSHSAEMAAPGYYSVSLPDNRVHAELTATTHTGMHRYTPSSSADSLYLLVDLYYGIGWDAPKDVAITSQTSTSLTGHRLSRGWAKDQRLYFTMQFSRPYTKAEMDKDGGYCIYTFAPDASPLTVKTGISAVSEEGAAANLAAECPTWDFDAVKAQAQQQWQDALSRIRIETEDVATQRKFYTALYHSMFAPMTFSDVTGEYRGADGQTYCNTSRPTYTLFSLWDTYRAAHPLYSLILPEMQPALVETFCDIYSQQGKLPVWHLHGNETDCMVGNPGAIVLADLTLKGYAPNPERAYEALRGTALLDERGLDLMKRYGYIPYDGPDSLESVARGMEYAIAYDATAQVARQLGKKDDFKRFNTLGKVYRHYYDPAEGFMRGKSMAGEFRKEKYSPFHASHRADDYCEGNGWQYLWLVPHDPHGLIATLGGEKRFVEKLDSLFSATGDLGGEASPDISGLIGQYAHGNEPSHHILYLYNYAGVPYKAAPLLREVMTNLYHDAPDGLCGNEDVGQMSSWYILSAMGLYQVQPAGGRYVIGTPIVDSASINVGGGKRFSIKAIDNSAENIYVQSATLNGHPHLRSYLDFNEIMQGGELVLKMGNKPSKFGTAKSARP